MATRGVGTPRQCPIGGPGLTQCPRTVRAGHLMCAPHWRQVPRDLGNLVWSTWRTFNRTGTDEAWTAYAEAREAALTYVEGPAAAPPPPTSSDARPW